MKVDIFIVSYHKDFEYLKYALRSIGKFATGFHRVVVMIPRRDLDAFYFAIPGETFHNQHFEVKPFDEWEGKGFLHHEYLIFNAPDYCPGADYIMHLDSDTIFTEPVIPKDYFVDGKPMLIYAHFDWLVKQQANLLNWKVAAQNALGIDVENEFMRRHPAVHPPEIYRRCKEMIEDHNHISLEEYCKAGKNSFPQSICEFVTLGAVAWAWYKDKYHWVNQEIDPWPPNKLKQFWSHAGVGGAQMEEFKKLGLA